jgi:hypothetical protein
MFRNTLIVGYSPSRASLMLHRFQRKRPFPTMNRVRFSPRKAGMSLCPGRRNGMGVFRHFEVIRTSRE